MANYELGNLVWRVTGDTRNFDKNITATDKKVGGLSSSFKSFAKTAAAALATVGIVDFGRKAIGAASDVEESINAVNVTFKEGADIVNEYGENAANSVGLARSEFNQLATVVGAQLKQAGLPIEDVANQTINLTERAADLASVFNTEVADATTALGAALRGETEPARQFGINISDAAVQAEALASGLVSSKDEINDQIKVQARYNLILKQSQDVAGDFLNTQDGLANSGRILKANFTDLTAELGQVLLPIAADVTKELLGVVKGFSGLSEGSKTFIVALAGIAAAAGPVSIALSALAANPLILGLAATAAAVLAINRAIAANNDITKEQQQLLRKTQDLNQAQIKLDEFIAEQQRKSGEDRLQVIEDLQNKTGVYGEQVESVYESLLRQVEVEQESVNTINGKIESLTALEESETAAIERQSQLNDALEKSSEEARKAEERVNALTTATDENAQANDTAGNSITGFADKYFEAIKRAGEASDEFKEKQEELAASIENAINGATNVIGQNLADALLLEQSWAKAFASIAAEAAATFIDTMAAIVQAQIAATIARAALLDGTAIAALVVGQGPALAGVAALKTAAAVVRSLPNLLEFQDGGVVPYQPGVPMTGDNVPARLNPGEMVLNQQQQAQLFAQANGAGGGGGSVVVNMYNTLNTDTMENINRAAQVLYPAIQKEGARRG